jgi:HPt (histidine-containing phosphotransfer) domain-containing protein
MSVQSVIDLPTYEALKDAMGADFITELVQAYFDETPQLLSKLQNALDRQDCDGFRLAAHSIKSTSNSFGALEFGALAKDLEMMGRQGNLDGAADKVETLVRYYGFVTKRLEELSHA